MKTYIIHHNDADGFGAAWSAYLKFGENAEYFPINYGWVFPKLDNNSDVYILDFSISREHLDELVSRMNSVLILDHHKSALENLNGHPNCFFDMNRSGAGIAWDYFHPNVPRPDFINYIEDQDLWRFSLPDSEYVRNSLTMIPHTIKDYCEASKMTLEDRIYEGKIIDKQIEYNLSRGIDYLHVMEIDEFRMLCVNVCLHQSNYGNRLLELIEKYNCHFAGVYYRVNQDFVRFSLRSKKDFDVSLVCKRFGGGEHFQAAGFDIALDRFNWKKISSKEV